MSRAADRERALEVADRLRGLGSITVTTFFGGAGIRLNEAQFAFVIKGTIYFRVNNFSRSKYESLGALPFSYAGRAKRVTVASYYQVPDVILEDADELRKWAVTARQAASAPESAKRKRPLRSRSTQRSER